MECGFFVVLSRLTLNSLKIRDQIGCDVEPEHEETRAGDVRHSQADVSAAREMLGYQGKIDLDEGLRRTVQWYTDNQ